jgi:GntR family transcriptional repressor for pyruvate dehydrogenase complex
VLNVMELRLAIEVEAAGLAAQRIAPGTLAPVRRALNDMKRAIAQGEDAVGEDFAFHRAIAAASGNPRFSELLEFLGRHVIPRQRLRFALTTAVEQRAYLARIQNEHERIYLSVKNGDPAAARAAMRAHLRGSLTRYRRLAERHALVP